MKGSIMETVFLTYLQNLKFYTGLHHANLPQDSRTVVLQAEQGRLRKLTGIFFDFPFEYSLEQAAGRMTFCAVSTAKRDRWRRYYNALLQQGNFDLAITQQLSTQLITANATTQANIQKLNLDIIVNACVTLLDGKNQLKPAIINFFGLQSLLAQHELHPAAVRKIIYSIIYSYWLEIVTVNLGLYAIQQDCDIRQLEALNGFSKQMLHKDKLFSPFFIECMNLYAVNFTQADMQACLQFLPADRVTGKLNFSRQRADELEDAQ
jgi:hypothetical protein